MFLLSLALTLSILANLYLCYKLGWIKLPKKDKLPKPRPQNPNSSVQVCQFCNKPGAHRSVDGYWVCPSCNVVVLRNANTA